MTPEQIKQKVKEAYTDVDSADFLQIQIKKGVDRHRTLFNEFKLHNPTKDFAFWKKKNEEINVNTTESSEVLAMGVFLLALDEFEKEIT